MSDDPLRVAVHWVHVILGMFWLGSMLYNRLSLRPALRALGEATAGRVGNAIVTGRGPIVTRTVAVATVATGIFRAVLDDAFDRLDASYGRTFLVALAIGVAMALYVNAPGLETRRREAAYTVAFPVIFTVMVALRFGGF